MKSTVSPRKPSIIALPSPRAKEKITHLIPAPRRRIQGVVGQEKAVAYLERELRNIEKGQPLPWFAFYDDLGLGKSHIVGAFMDAVDLSQYFSIPAPNKQRLSPDRLHLECGGAGRELNG